MFTICTNFSKDTYNVIYYKYLLGTDKYIGY